MNPTRQPVLSPGEVGRILVVHAKRWLVPAVALGLMAAVYAVVRPATWEASQALIVRNEAANNRQELGKFSHTDEMKTLQETILELVKSRGVLKAALTEVGPPEDHKENRSAWPTPRDVVRLRKNIKLDPPKGAEFGKTEVFYLKVRSNDRTRAVALATVIVEDLKTRFQQLLDDRAASMINELEKAGALAQADLEVSTGKLAELERGVGSDLAELRILHESPSGGSDLRQKAVEVENELRAAKTDRRAKAELSSLLQSALSDPSRVEALPSRLLESQASLRRLSEGLSAARLETSDLLGRMTDAHPLVQAAKAEQREVLANLNGELRNAIQIAEVELRLTDARVESLEEQLADVLSRFDHLAGLRTGYANLVAETQNRTDLLQTARRTMADARASQAAARTASLIAQIDRPDAGTRPVGLSRSMTVLAGLGGGLLAGFGVLLLTVQPAPMLMPPPAAELSAPQHSLPVLPAWPPTALPAALPGDAATPPGGALSMRGALEKIAYASKT